MKYRCRQCNNIDNEPGNCPTCNIPMEIKLQEDETSATPAEETVEETATPDAPATDGGDGDAAPAPAAPAEEGGDAPAEEGGEKAA